ncbi:MAG: STAS domain-containing protein [Bacteroidetes bacterium]|nr:STAS domain-containing protein [Bacteroidota bacterium]
MITVDHIENTYLVSFFNTTKLNVLNAKETESQLIPLVKQQGTTLTLNLNGIKFIDSSGFEMLLSLYKTAKINNATLRLINVTDELTELIKLVELDHVFELNKNI